MIVAVVGSGGMGSTLDTSSTCIESSRGITITSSNPMPEEYTVIYIRRTETSEYYESLLWDETAAIRSGWCNPRLMERLPKKPYKRIKRTTRCGLYKNFNV